MRADVKALDQISAKVNPIITDLMSIDFSRKKGRRIVATLII
jgi:hypothetical protein